MRDSKKLSSSYLIISKEQKEREKKTNLAKEEKGNELLSPNF